MNMKQQEAKNEIMGLIASATPPATALPEMPVFQYNENPLTDFIRHLLGFDGRAIEFKTREDAIAWLQAQPEFDAASERIYSSVADIRGNVTEEDIADLRNARKIQICVTEGEFGVGEMGAIWVTDATLKHAVCALLARRLFILLDAGRIMGSLHDAYAAIKIQEHQYGSFYTGPSATADIEAVHITGAQGPLGLTAVLYNCESAPESPKLQVNPQADTSAWVKSMENDE